MIAKTTNSLSPEFLTNAGDTILLIGFHRLDSIMLWSYLAGKAGRIVLIEAVPEYIENVRINLQHHLNWPLENIVYVNKAVASVKGTCRIQIGRRADFNKAAGQLIDDQLPATEFPREIEIESDSVDQILADVGIDRVDHVHVTISGMEVEALKGMPRVLRQPGLRICVRSLHTKDGDLLYPQVSTLLMRAGLRVCLGHRQPRFRGRDVYGTRFTS
jgi:FkbM family methyltransferase